MTKHYLAAALAGLALTACSEKQEKAATPPQQDALQEGFYRATNGTAAVFDTPNGPYRYVRGISADTCVRVTENGDVGDFVRAEILGEERALFDIGNKYLRKDELRRAPECAALVASFDASATSLKSGQGYTLKYDTALHGETPSTLNGYLSRGDCVRMGENPAGARTVRVAAHIPGTIMTGNIDAYAIDPAKTCKLTL